MLTADDGLIAVVIGNRKDQRAELEVCNNIRTTGLLVNHDQLVKSYFQHRSADELSMCSPEWLREKALRLQRARARIRVRRAQAALVQPPRRDLLRLESHHSRPRYRSSRLPVMGKGWDQNKPKGNGKPSGGSRWGYWRGSWGSPSYKEQDYGAWENAEPSSAFPAYDAKDRASAVKRAEKEVPKAAGKAAGRGKDAPDPEGYLTAGLQDYINSTRKAEQRVRNLTATRAQKVKLWEKWQEDMKVSYLRELTRFEKAMRTLDADLEAAVGARDEARQAIRQHIQNEGHVAVDAGEEEEINWEDMTRQWRQEQQEQKDQDAPREVLRRAMKLQEAPSVAPPAVAPSLGGLMTPEAAAKLFMATMTGQMMSAFQQEPRAADVSMAGAPSAMAPLPSQAAGAVDPSLAAPYVASPSTRHTEHPTSPNLPPKGTTAPRPRPSPRQPLKGAPLQPVHTQTPAKLESKLEAKRAALQSEMEAAATDAARESAAQATRSAEAPQRVQLNDDDSSDVEPMDRGPPGSCRLTGFVNSAVPPRFYCTQAVEQFQAALPDVLMQDGPLASTDDETRPHLQRVVPVVPQPNRGAAAFLAFPACLDDFERVAVVLDLSHVGGGVFAVHLASGCTAEALLHLVRAEVNCELEDVAIHVNAATEPTDRNEALGVAHGSLVVLLRRESPVPAHQDIVSLLQSTDTWEPVVELRVSSGGHAVAVWFRDEFHVLQPERFPGQDVLSVIADRFRVPACTLHIASTQSLDAFAINGEACCTLSVVSEYSGPADDDFGQYTARDVLSIVCDLRPAGFVPLVVRMEEDLWDVSALQRRLAVPSTESWLFGFEEVLKSGSWQDPCLAVIRAVQLSASRLAESALRAQDPFGLIAAVVQGSHLLSSGEPTRVGALSTPRQGQLRPAIASDSETSATGSRGPPVEGQVLVLTVDRASTVFEFELAVPATIAELIAVVDEERAPAFYLQYPNLVEVLPQPSSRWATLLALPGWTAAADVVVLDTTGIDGRIFPVCFPHLASFARICELAGLSPDGNFAIFPFGAQVPLAQDDAVRIVQHGCVFIRQQGAPPPVTGSLLDMLSSAAGWDVEVEVPRGPGGLRSNFACIVLEEGARLLTLRPLHGRHHLEALAEEYGLPLHWTTAQATRPLVQNACHQGYRCKGVALVSSAFPNVPVPPARHRPGDFVIALDCRSLFQGWHQYVVRDFRCSHSEIAMHFDTFAPDGFLVQIDGASLEDDNLIVSKGMVLTLTWTPVTPASQIQEAIVIRILLALIMQVIMCSPPMSGEMSGVAAAGLLSDMQRRICFLRQCWLPKGQVPNLHELQGSPILILVHCSVLFPRPCCRCRPPLPEVVRQPVDIPFLVFACEYWPETLSVVLAPPVSVLQALASVNEARDGFYRDLFPVLLPVNPQPLSGEGIVLAIPSWSFDFVPVLVDRIHLDGRMHCAMMSPVMDRLSILRAIGQEPRDDVVVYVRDHPWVLGNGQTCPLQPGDLICVARVDHGAIITMSLEDALLSTEGWLPEAPLPGSYDAAYRIIWDHCADGVYSRTVLAAVPVTVLAAAGDPGIVIVDMRPILQGLQWQVLGSQGFDLEAFVQRMRPHCPSDCFVQVRGGTVRHTAWSTFLTVPSGGVLTVHFVLADFESSATDEDGRSEPGDDEEPGGDEDSDGRDAGNFYRGQSSSGGASSGPAASSSEYVGSASPCGDGSCLRLPFLGVGLLCFCAAYAVLVVGRVAMWSAEEHQPAHSAGHQRLTPVLPTKADEPPARNDSYDFAFPAYNWWSAWCGSGVAWFFPGVGFRPRAGRRASVPWPAGPGSSSGVPFRAPWLLLYAAGGLLLLARPVQGVQFVPPVIEGVDSCSADCEVRDIAERGFVAMVAVLSYSVSLLRAVGECPLLSVCEGGETWQDAICGWFAPDAVGPTLLEVCVMEDAAPFFMARTLIEAVWEFLHENNACVLPLLPALDDGADNGGKIEEAKPARILVLEDLVPDASAVSAADVEIFDLTEGQCALPCSVGQAQTLFQKIDLRRVNAVPCNVPKPERFHAWVADGAVGRTPGPHETLVLTADGSYNPDTGAAGWAVVLSASSDAALDVGQFIGCLFGSVVPAVAPEGNSAYIAEVVGLWWAAVVAFQVPTPVAVLFRADNQAALDGVSGSVQTPDTALCTAARSFHMALDILSNQEAAYRHVRGHCGDVANELADGLANLGAVGHDRVGPFMMSPEEWLSHGAAAAKWLPHVCLSTARPRSLPQHRDNLFAWSARQAPPVLTPSQLLHPFTRALGAHAGTPSCKSHEFMCRCVSFNALSLLQPDAPDKGKSDGLYGAVGRVGLLADSLKSAGVFLAGVQEARTPEGCSRHEAYTRYCSGATERNCYGVELWIARGPDWPMHSFSVGHADPCRLIGSLEFSGMVLSVFVGHGPHRAHPSQTKQAWWAESLRLCRNFTGPPDWIVLVDGNCRVGSEVSSFVGGHQPDLEDESGAAFHELLQQLKVWLPSTFAFSMQGGGGT
ncbi:unnamed protein product [Symbiodinium sp. CCMP2592]|nr:unnamed protein product [Symbiodinium sp. CCMP2592]